MTLDTLIALLHARRMAGGSDFHVSARNEIIVRDRSGGQVGAPITLFLVPDLFTFRIRFRREHGDVVQAQVVDATCLTAAMEQVGRVWALAGVSMRCTGQRRDGTQCKTFSSDDRCATHRATR